MFVAELVIAIAATGTVAIFGGPGPLFSGIQQKFIQLGTRAMTYFQATQTNAQTNKAVDIIREQNEVIPRHISALEAATDHHSRVTGQVIHNIGEKIDGVNVVADQIDAGAAKYEQCAEQYREQADRVDDLVQQMSSHLEKTLADKDSKTERLTHELNEVIRQRDQIIADAKQHIQREREETQKVIAQLQARIKDLESNLARLES